MTHLDELKASLKRLLVDDEISTVLERLESAIPANNVGKFNTLILIRRDFKLLNDLSLRGTQSFENLSIKQASCLENLINFIDSLHETDLAPPPAAEPGPSPAPRRSNRTGSVLYSIPSRMVVGKERKCVVRLSFDEALLLYDLAEGDELQIKEIRRIGERMEVELVDPNEEAAFTFRSISSPVQTVEQDDYTEWIYFVKPQKEGVHDLWLKVMVIIKKDGEKIKKDIVLQEQIEVLTQLEEEVETTGIQMKRAGLLFTIGFAGIGGGAAGESPAEPSSVESIVESTGSIFSSVASKVSLAIATLAIIGGAYFAFSPGSDTNVSSNEPFPPLQEEQLSEEKPEQYASLQPLPNLQPDSFLYRILPTLPNTIRIPSGTTFEIPANILTDENGDLLTDSVDFIVQEIKRAHEIIGRGIPMRYFDDTEKEHWLQTAGMFELKAIYRGRETQIKLDQSINIHFVSEVEGDYDFWQLNQGNGNWKKLQENVRDERISMTSNLKKRIKELEIQTRTPPTLPQLYENRRYAVADIDLSCCPELKTGGGKYIRLTYAGADPKQAPENNEWVYAKNRRWWKRSMQRTQLGKDVYQLTYEAADVSFQTLLRPSRESDNKEERMAQYEKEKKAYDRKLSELREKRALMVNQHAFRRTVSVNQLGIYNFDRLLKEENTLQLAADFDMGEISQDLKDHIIVYLITADGRSVIQFPTSSWDQFRFLSDSQNQLVAFLPGQKIARFTDEDFQREAKAMQLAREAGSNYVFRMRIMDFTEESLENLGQLLDG